MNNVSQILYMRMLAYKSGAAVKDFQKLKYLKLTLYKSQLKQWKGLCECMIQSSHRFGFRCQRQICLNPVSWLENIIIGPPFLSRLPKKIKIIR